MYILADANLPLAAELCQQLCRDAGCSTATVELYSTRQPPAAQLAAAEAMLVRSVTKVDSALLQQAPRLRWVGSGTIGTEHLDAGALTAAGIAFTHTPGVNANAVGDYVASAVAAVSLRHGQLPAGEAAIIGAGHTGRAAGQRLEGLGLQVHYYDPPLVASGTAMVPVHADWQRVLRSAVISCHVPLTTSGPWPTRYLLDDKAVKQLLPDTLIINASRGPVIEQQAIARAIQHQPALRWVLDVWESEPQIAADLLPYIELATPHIAGHSLAGKLGGTRQLCARLAAHLRWPDKLPPLSALLNRWPTVTGDRQFYSVDAPDWQTLASWVLAIYDIRQDDKQLRAAPPTPIAFDALRRNYQPRAELNSGLVSGGAWINEPFWQQRLQQLNLRSNDVTSF
ncbi:4-phosphoerythronate dehydrogenase [Pseudidiomarina sp.]|uniref:4-phosphoerythronate dehydrogenase n=1 Tax=Pseudidiomarina sp. TaxID=2081707 RepID=UPI00299E86CB|nr:4-phosphoerythronate dehydrogenase [Pseudidiomarina sp.]MDX1705858.1 4-phosphoerythronate dehydrogenase [Pseudidiomarina sp.]